MKIQIVNDLHIECRNISDIDNVAPILVVAGDLCTWISKYAGVDLLNEWAEDRELVFFILGNHEYYHGNVAEVENFWFNEAPLSENVIMLRAGKPYYHDKGYLFVGDTLWTDLRNGSDSSLYATSLNDIRCTKGLTSELVCSRNLLVKDLLAQSIRAGGIDKQVIMITHHLPMQEVISPRYVGDPLNSCFANYDTWAENMLREFDIPMWHFGHTHDPIDLNIRGCRFVCNPHGYYDECASTFNPAFVVEV